MSHSIVTVRSSVELAGKSALKVKRIFFYKMHPKNYLFLCQNKYLLFRGILYTLAPYLPKNRKFAFKTFAVISFFYMPKTCLIQNMRNSKPMINGMPVNFYMPRL